MAIDGPAGTGKSSVTKRLATELGFVHVDTGALYRAIALLAAEKNQDPVVVAHETHLEFHRIVGRNPANRIFANSQDVTERIRTPEISMAASRISAIPEVRASLLGLQRRLGCVGRTILEGRDIGTVVFPDADVKFFLTATVEERAKRRLIELEAQGGDTPSFEELKKQIAERDEGDSTRVTAPMKRAQDAILIDTTTLSLDQVVAQLKAHVERVLQGVQ